MGITDAMALELYNTLKQSVYLGTFNFKKQSFRNLKVIDDYVSPIIEAHKEIEKNLDEYRKEITKITLKYSSESESMEGNSSIAKYGVDSTGKMDTSVIRKEYLDFQKEYKVLEKENKTLIETYHNNILDYNKSLENPIPSDILESMKSKFVKITGPLPKKENGDDAINSYILMEFDILEDEEVEVEETKTTKKKSKK